MKKYIQYLRSIGLLQSVGLFFNFVFYRLKYMDLGGGKRGYFLVKRIWLWYLLTPMLLIVYVFFGICQSIKEYFESIHGFYHHWVEREEKPMNLDEKIVYRRNLWN